jgi:hypothetical protein
VIVRAFIYGFLTISITAWASKLDAHGGGLDDGCHNNRKASGYHCHRGPYAGESFSSKEEMLRRGSGKRTRESDAEKKPILKQNN